MPGRLCAIALVLLSLSNPKVVQAADTCWMASAAHAPAVPGAGAGGTKASYPSHSPAERYFWLCPSIGGATNGTCFGLASSALIRRHLLTIRYIYVEEPGYLEISGNDTDWEVALLYGRAARSSYLQFSMSVGASVLGGSYAGQGTYGPVLGLPVASQIVYLAHRSFGVGLCGYADFNTERTAAGLLSVIYFGRLKER